MDLRQRVERVIAEKVRPTLAGHDGDLEIVSLEDGVLKVRFLGACQNCPSASATLEGIVSAEVKDTIPEIADVILVTGVSDETIGMAKQILRQRRERREDRD